MGRDAPGRIPTLDGLRALSIGLVLIAHLFGTRNFPTPALWKLPNLGELGVRVFFVISGFLITTLLIQEQRRTQRISIKDFYIRRVYRIFPAFYAFLAVLLLLGSLGLITLDGRDFLSAVTYTVNYRGERGWIIGHLWSLSVEEQFYLLWPATLSLFGLAGGRRFAIAVLVLAPVARVVELYILHDPFSAVGQTFETIFDSIATGCLLAMVRDDLGQRPRYLAFLASRWFWLVPPAVFLVNMSWQWPRIYLSVGHTLMNLGIALILERALRWPDARFGRFLELRPLVFVGTLSYSLYLWQQPFIDRAQEGWIHAFPLNIAGAVLAALGSYYLVEKPFLALRARRAKPSRSNTASSPP
ncbi:MAG: acyltransferase [Myxococcota bacterium]